MKEIGSVIKIREIFDANKDKRICVVGVSCVGKSTLLSYFPEAVDMDDLLFGNKEKGFSALLAKEAIDYVCGEWTVEVGRFMKQKAHELIKIKPGHPVFGTIVFPADLVIDLTVCDDILRERIIQRKANEHDIFKMKEQIKSEIEKSGVKTISIESM